MEDRKYRLSYRRKKLDYMDVTTYYTADEIDDTIRAWDRICLYTDLDFIRLDRSGPGGFSLWGYAHRDASGHLRVLASPEPQP